MLKRDNIIGESDVFLQFLEELSKISKLNRPVLLIGERGTGKELMAERIHYLSLRWDKVYLKLNCASLSEGLLESELFGHEVGAFTGAVKKHIGRFELASKGTLFLDEISNTSLRLQEKILRVVEYGEFERVGGSTTLFASPRIIAATNEDLPKLSKAGKFREDLLDRLAFDVLTIPPLRKRSDDILLLANKFAIKMTKELGGEYFPGFSETVIQQLLEYPWPGNVRELKNVIERAIYKNFPSEKVVGQIQFDPFISPYRSFIESKSIKFTGKEKKQNEIDQIQDGVDIDEKNFVDLLLKKGPVNFKKEVANFEKKILSRSLKINKFNKKETAQFLKLTYNQLRGMLRKYKLEE